MTFHFPKYLGLVFFNDPCLLSDSLHLWGLAQRLRQDHLLCRILCLVGNRSRLDCLQSRTLPHGLLQVITDCNCCATLANWNRVLGLQPAVPYSTKIYFKLLFTLLLLALKYCFLTGGWRMGGVIPITRSSVIGGTVTATRWNGTVVMGGKCSFSSYTHSLPSLLLHTKVLKYLPMLWPRVNSINGIFVKFPGNIAINHGQGRVFEW